jgi:hypothetical protein
MSLTPGGLLNKVPAPTKQALGSNYIDFTSATTKGWAQQYLPDLMEAEAEVFGTRTVSGFLSQVGAEEAMSSDQVIWSEQGRLHLAYTGTATTSGTVSKVVLTFDIDGNAVATSGVDHGVRIGDMVLISDADAEIRAYVSAVDEDELTVLPYDRQDLADVNSSPAVLGIANGTVKLFVFGSEFTKASEGRTVANAPKFKTFHNKPIIMKDYYEVAGSDVTQIGWVEVTGEEGQNGYYWYLKAEGDTRARFADYTEMAMIEARKVGAPAGTTMTQATSPTFTNGGSLAGTEGLFAAIEDRGNISEAVVSTGGTAANLVRFDNILKEFDKQGAIEENMLFLNRTAALGFDDMLGQLGAFITGNNAGAGGASYGVFENDANMALNLGFNGFRRGSYDFYKTDWKYLNDKSTRGSSAAQLVKGVVVPAGVSTVYDGTLGKNLKRPFLHVRYRAGNGEDRKMKSWVTGSVGGNITSSLDAMQIHMLTERCLIVQGANNFMLMK